MLLLFFYIIYMYVYGGGSYCICHVAWSLRKLAVCHLAILPLWETTLGAETGLGTFVYPQSNYLNSVLTYFVSSFLPSFQRLLAQSLAISGNSSIS